MWLHSKKLFLGVLLFVFAIILWGPFYTQDGPNHQKTTLILSRLDSSPIESSVYSNGLGVLKTNTIFPLLYLPLKSVLSIASYEKIFFAVFLCLLLISFRYFLSTYSPQNISLWVLALPTLFHPLYLRGFYNFLAASGLSMIAMTLAYKDITSPQRKISLKAFSLYFIICWLAQLSHPFSFFIIPLTLCVWFIQDKNRLWKIIPYLALASAYFLLQFALPLFSNGIGTKSPYAFGTLPILLGGLIGLNFMDYTVYGLILPLPFLIILGFVCYKNISSSGIKRNLLWLAPLFAYFLFPRSGGGSAHMNERFLPFIFFFIPASLKLEVTSKLAKRLALVSLATFVVVSSGNFLGMHYLKKEEASAREALSHLPPVSKLYPINFNLRGAGKINWHLAHIWAVYPEDKIVFSPYLFSLPDFTPLKKSQVNSQDYFPATEEDFPRRQLESTCQSGFLYDIKDCEGLKKEALRTIFQSAQYYDYWFVYKPNPLFLNYLQSLEGLKEISHQGDYSLWHYEKALLFNPQKF